MVLRQFNADTKYFIAPGNTEESGLEEAWVELADGIITIDPDINEESEEFAYYDLDGGSEEVVGSISQSYSVEGHHDPQDPAQKIITEMEWKKGDDRVVWFKIVDTDQTTFTGKATVLEIKVRGGDANAYRPISCSIRFRGVPKQGKETPEI